MSAATPTDAPLTARQARRAARRAAQPAIAERPLTNRSRVTNGKEVLPGTNGNTILGRRYRDLVAAIAADLGGPDNLSHAKAQMVRRFAAISCQLEAMEAQLVNGEDIDDEKYARLTSSLVRVSMRLGMKRERPSKDIAPRPTPATLQDYIAAHRAADAAADAEEAEAEAAAEVGPDA